MTKLLKPGQIAEGAAIIKAGGIVAFRTETVYGLGCDAANTEAIEKIYIAKNRPHEKALPQQVSSVADLKEFFPDTDAAHMNLFRKLKHVTVVLPSGIAVRIPSDGFARKFLRACETPLAVTSANISGQPSRLTWREVYADLNGKVDAIFMNGKSKLGVPSTIIKLAGGKLQIIRQGSVTAEQITKKTGYCIIK